jgi:hypothetical protein
MLVKINTKFSLDAAQAQGRKNLDLVIIAAGLRSQVEVRSVSKVKRGWELVLYLERPEFWGTNLEFLREDIENLVVYHQNTPTTARGLATFSPIPINTASIFGDGDDPRINDGY